MSSLHPGDHLDHYRIDGLVARSGMASIFRGTDLRNGRSVAIKVPHPEVESDPALFDRFRREEEIGKILDHPGVMKVFVDGDRSQVYMVMEWVDGLLLRKILDEQHKLPTERAIRLALRMLDALGYIHSRGVAHRDLKPENIMVDENDAIKIIDFGIAASSKSRRLTFAKLSQTMGTPDYISPEQVKGKRGDARSDLYALGVMLYEMLLGKVPFSGANPFLIMNDRLLNNPVPPRELDHLQSPGARSQEPLSECARFRLGSGASGSSGSRGTRSPPRLEASPHSLAEESFVLRDVGSDSHRDIWAAFVRGQTQLATQSVR